MLYWRMTSGVLLTSVLMPTAQEEDKRKVRCYLRRSMPHGAEAWSCSPDGPWRPPSELPPAWGLKPHVCFPPLQIPFARWLRKMGFRSTVAAPPRRSTYLPPPPEEVEDDD